ncbi:MAG: UDP-N-acetylmuramoyl-tripeptide--D-alanyl-D-alanine ligase [Synergistaceae bacterium]
MKEIMASKIAIHLDADVYGQDISVERNWLCDSRDVLPGDAFVAIKGSKVDGHAFIEQVIDKGASLIVINKDEVDKLGLAKNTYSNITFIAVSDTVKVLSDMARFVLKEIAPTVVGITGSVGKTTTRELVGSILRSYKKVHSAIRSFNTVIGCSLTILSMPYDTDILLLEFGTNHHGEIREMVGLFPPEIVIITEVVSAHLEGLGSLEGVLKAKIEICESVALKTIIYNSDNEILDSAIKKFADIGVRVLPVGYKSDIFKILKSDLYLSNSIPALRTKYLYCDSCFETNIPFFGNQHSYNLAYAILLAFELKISKNDIINALKNVKPVSGRGVCKELVNSSVVIDESYNANPASMLAAIENLRSIKEINKVDIYAVLGGMRELGEKSLGLHEQLVPKLADFTKVFLLGNEWNLLTLKDNMQRYASIDEIEKEVKSLVKQSNLVLLVKGSNSYGLNRVVKCLVEDN